MISAIYRIAQSHIIWLVK